MKIIKKTRRAKPAFVDYKPAPAPIAYQIRNTEVISEMDKHFAGIQQAQKIHAAYTKIQGK